MVEETEGGHVWVVDQLVLEQVCCGLMVLLFGVVWIELGCSSPVYHSKLWTGFVSQPFTLRSCGHVVHTNTIFERSVILGKVARATFDGLKC